MSYPPPCMIHVEEGRKKWEKKRKKSREKKKEERKSEIEERGGYGSGRSSNSMALL